MQAANCWARHDLHGTGCARRSMRLTLEVCELNAAWVHNEQQVCPAGLAKATQDTTAGCAVACTGAWMPCSGSLKACSPTCIR